MPGCSMKIFSGDPSEREVAENVKIGDPLTLVVTLDEQDVYGIRVTDCLVSFKHYYKKKLKKFQILVTFLSFIIRYAMVWVGENKNSSTTKVVQPIPKLWECLSTPRIKRKLQCIFKPISSRTQLRSTISATSNCV